jgi:hypothetical protein
MMFFGMIEKWSVSHVTTLTLGLWPKQGMERCEPKVQLKSHIYTPRMGESVREWTHTFPNGLPLWELESRIFKK